MILLPLEICERVFCLGRQGILKTGDQSLIKDSLGSAFRLVCSCGQDQASPDALCRGGLVGPSEQILAIPVPYKFENVRGYFFRASVASCGFGVQSKVAAPDWNGHSCVWKLL